MENLTKDDFEKWAKGNNWLQVGEPPNPNGRQLNFVTPTGNFVAAVFNLEGKLIAAVPMQMPPIIQSPGFPPFHGPSTLGKS
jgi:hypothetical protein